MTNKNKKTTNSKGLNYIQLTAVAIGATIGGGVFSIAGDMASKGANTGAVLIGWLICGIGMQALILCFFNLNRIRPELTGGIYSYAKEGWGDYVGFNSAWGYWLSTLLAIVSYATLLFASIGYFISIFGKGNNLISIVCASILIWIVNYFVLKGVKKATSINVVITISKIVPILVFIVTLIFLKAFDWNIFIKDFWGESGNMSFLNQLRATSQTTVWSFVGIEGAVVISGRAKYSSDVGKATITAFLGVLTIYILVAVLSMGVLDRSQLAGLSNPPMAGVLKSVVGSWGAALVNIGVIISLLGATLGYTIIATECPYEASKKGAFPKIFTKENKNGAPVFSIFLTNSIVQIFLIITYFSSSTYQVFYSISTSMILIPYLLSAMYYFKISLNRNKLKKDYGTTFSSKIIGLIGTIYGIWLIYASGLIGLGVTALFYLPGTLVYIKGKKDHNEIYFSNNRDIAILIVLVALAFISLYLLLTGRIALF
ncbi:amino acid permease [Sedimentibacter sp. zth1]|uniref:basic amino acid/polyamine antiporter n=1 Tax=Sedimentibacter sp. zth1 TaxID=2816908 RepID=UPI001A9271C5|nr:basic amino acid/polyamine antiporter [Sedimentibacter sp. zth1]QSX04761.1 amino acid permease [Sedimentibacter sp. zth1]